MRIVRPSRRRRRRIIAQRLRIRAELAEESLVTKYKSLRDRDIRIAELEAQLDKKSK